MGLSKNSPEVVALRELLQSEVGDLAAGAKADVDAYLDDIALEIAIASASGDTSWRDELQEQAEFIGNRNRTRLDKSGFRVLRGIVMTVFKLGLGAVS